MHSQLITDSIEGYQALMSYNLNPHGRGDFHEGFEHGWEDMAKTTRLVDANPSRNVWPSEDIVPNFRKDVLTY